VAPSNHRPLTRERTSGPPSFAGGAPTAGATARIASVITVIIDPSPHHDPVSRAISKNPPYRPDRVREKWIDFEREALKSP
jgi:hypothetical protein